MSPRGGRQTQLVQQSRHLPALDGLRGVAVLMVFFYHYGGGATSHNPLLHAFGLVNKAGWSGVTLFFVLSGFLITGILWDSSADPHRWRNFYMRRTLRIAPLYFAVILAGLAYGFATHRAAAWERQALMLATYTQNMPIPALLAQEKPVGHLWSLAVEEQFYLLWPLLLWATRTRRQALLLCGGTFLLSFVFRVLLLQSIPNPASYHGFLLVRAGELATGAALALLYRSPRWAGVQRAAPFVCGTGLMAFVACSWLMGGLQLYGERTMVFHLTCLTFCFAGLLVMALTPGWAQRAASARWLRWVGGLGYGIYVYQLLLARLYDWAALKLAPDAGSTRFHIALLLTAAVGTLLAAWLSFRLLERPAMKWKRYFPSHAAVPPQGEAQGTSQAVST